MKILGVIPARYASTRFPGKALANIGGKTMIQRVYEQASKSKSLDNVMVATDDERIVSEVKAFNGKAMMTSEKHESGTDRCNEVLQSDNGYDYIINIQGDEPFIDPHQIDLLASILDGKTELATLIKKINSDEDIHDPNVVKCVVGHHGKALYFSRAPVPFHRNSNGRSWHSDHTYFKHIGIYAYRSDILEKITKLRASRLENIESLEQLRWLENGYSINVKETEIESIGIDTPDDLNKIQSFL